MKKTTKPAIKKAAPKKPATKKSPAKPTSKAQRQPELVAIVARLERIADRLADATTQLVGAGVRLSATQESQQESESQLERPGEDIVGVVVVDESEREE